MVMSLSSVFQVCVDHGIGILECSWQSQLCGESGPSRVGVVKH